MNSCLATNAASIPDRPLQSSSCPSRARRSMPTVEVYRPPPARFLSSHNAEPVAEYSDPSQDLKAADKKTRRPDIQVYVPRPRRLVSSRPTPTPSPTPCIAPSRHHRLSATWEKSSNKYIEVSPRCSSNLETCDGKSTHASEEMRPEEEEEEDEEKTIHAIVKTKHVVKRCDGLDDIKAKSASKVNGYRKSDIICDSRHRGDENVSGSIDDEVVCINSENEEECGFPPTNGETVRNGSNVDSFPDVVTSVNNKTISRNRSVADKCVSRKNLSNCVVEVEINEGVSQIVPDSLQKKIVHSDVGVLKISECNTPKRPNSDVDDKSVRSPTTPEATTTKLLSSPPRKQVARVQPLKSELRRVASLDTPPVTDTRILTPNLSFDECSWDTMFDENGDCLDPRLMEELTLSVGKVKVKRPSMDYSKYKKARELVLAEAEHQHVLEVYGFSADFKTQDLMAALSPMAGTSGCEVKWVDDTHALVVFSNSHIAAEVLALQHPLLQARPLSQASPEAKNKARRSGDFLRPYRPRPETCSAMAKRLVTSALGVKLKTSAEEREKERNLLKQARDKKRLAAKQSEEAWEGTIGGK